MKVPQELLSKLKLIQAAIELKTVELEALKTHMDLVIKEAVGVDTSNGDWVLDLEAGELYEHGR